MCDSGNGSVSDEFTVLLEGGRPWGFTLRGGADFRSPLKIGKVTPGGRADKAGLLNGDNILTINGVPTTQMKHHEAQRLILLSTNTVELVCTKVQTGLILSPKSALLGQSFVFPLPRSTTPVEGVGRSSTLGRHVRQSSLDLNYLYRPRSSSDAGKRATVGVKIAGITVPAPPPFVKTKHNTGVMKQGQEKVIAGIKVPPPPPSFKSRSTGELPISGVLTNRSSSSPTSKATLCNGSTSLLSDHEDDSSTATSLSDSKEPIEHIKIFSKPEDVQDSIIESELSSYKIGLNNIHHIVHVEDNINNKSDETHLQSESEVSEDISSTSGKDSHTFTTSGEEVISKEEDIQIENIGRGGNDWYKAMFQSMKKGVEEDLPDKKHVHDRSPLPYRKFSFEVEPTHFQSVNSESKVSEDIPSTSGKDSQTFTSSGEDVISKEDIQIENIGTGGNDWYKAMFQSMKKGVEEDLPDKKHVQDRSPLPYRKFSFDAQPKTEAPSAKPVIYGQTTRPSWNHNKSISYVSSALKRRSSESSLPSQTTTTILPKPRTLTRPSSGSSIGVTTPKPDVVSGISSNVVYSKNSRSFSLSRNYWKSIEEYASQERIAKRNSLPRSSSCSSTGELPSPETVNSVEDPTTPTDTQSQTPFFKEEVITVLSTDQTPIVEEELEDETRQNKSPEAIDSVNEEETIMTNLHPLLKGEVVDDKKEENTEDLPQQNVFTRIDPTKLNTALGNATVLGNLEKEGVTPVALQAVAISLGNQTDEQNKPSPQRKKSKSIKPPPGKKAKASFDFVAASEKELSFKKGEIVNLKEQVDVNWLKGEMNGKTGIFPVSFVRILSPEEESLLEFGTDLLEEPLLNQIAQAKHNFTANSERELSFNKGDIIYVVKSRDENWFEASIGDRSGIVPKSYVQIFEPEN